MMMDGIKGGDGGGGRVGIGEEDMGDGMQCRDHPYRNNPGGICAFCLQEKLGKLVSSSFPLPIRGSSSSSSPSPSFRSDIGIGGGGAAATSLSLSVRPTPTKGGNDGGNSSHYQENYTRRARILPFLLAKKKKKIMVASSSTSSSSTDRDVVLKRSKSTTTASRSHCLDDGEGFTPRKRGGFWSFLYLSSSSKSTATSDLNNNTTSGKRTVDRMSSLTTTTNGSLMKPKEKCLGPSLSRNGDHNHFNVVVEEPEDESPNSQTTASAASSFERRVSRSRSVGCGSRSFSGDFFERISTGFGDCTLRRVESQREGKPKVPSASHMKERVKCGGIFGGFVMTSSSSSSSSSSYWVSSSSTEDMKSSTAGGALVHSRSKSWGWAFSSPMRAFNKASSKDGRKTVIIREASSKNTTSPNLAAFPSLLSVSS